jgi:outer membrane protein OmpA-like peptidoglycan-associated protein
MPRFRIVALSLAVAFAAGAASPLVWQLDLPAMLWSDASGPVPPAPKHEAKPASVTPRLPESDPNAPSFDVVRIDPERISVLAGRAPPDATVIVSADGQAVATTKADGSGDWMVTTDHPFPAGERKLSLSAVTGDLTTAGQAVTINLEASGGPKAPEPAPERLPVAQVSASPAPVTFVFGEAKLTSQGERALKALHDFLQQRGVDKAALSGHADERGNAQFNVELSRERLEVVASYLRRSGYAGELELLAKGATEPYAGLDRRSTPREVLYQLDRRVELLLPAPAGAANQKSAGGVAARAGAQR